jgi:hypothetical protein
MNRQTYDNGQPINATVPSPGFTNVYIEGFAANMSSLMLALYNRAGVRNYIVWNEPNDAPQEKRLEPDRFSALLRRTWIQARSLHDENFSTPSLGPLMIGDFPIVKLYWGGILMGKDPGDQNRPDPGHLQYIRDVYMQARLQRESMGEDYGGGRTWPWHGINIHPHEHLSQDYVDQLRNDLIEIQNNEDQSDVLIGEWGIPLSGSNSQNYPDTESALLRPTFDHLRSANWTYMFYYSHHLNEDTNTHVDWGVRRYYFAGGTAFTPCPDVPNPFPSACLNMSGRLGPASGTLYDSLQEALDHQ